MSAPADDPAIANTAVLWRRIRPDWVVYDKNLDRWRPKTIAFQNYRGTDAMSVILAGARDDDPTKVIAGKHADYFLVEFTAGFARQLDQGVVEYRDPDEPGHHHVTGKKTGSVQDKFAKGASWTVSPPVDFNPDAIGK